MQLSSEYNLYAVIGLQRTGTNWINELVRHNLDIKSDNKHGSRYCWKHWTPLGLRETCHYKKYANPIFLHMDNCFYIATSKPFDMWVKSLERWTKSDFNYSHQIPTGCVTPDQQYKAVYEAWHEWKDLQKGRPNFYFKTYLDWLDNWKEYLDEISHIGQFKKRVSSFQNVKRVPMNSEFNIRRYKPNA